MATGRNQPQYDFLTGQDPGFSARETLRASVLVRPDSSNEEFRAQVHKLQYDIESLKQERDATALRHQEQLRFAENKADADFTKLQASESARLAAVSRSEALTRDLEEAQARHALEKRDLERKLRASQEENAAMVDELEEVKTELPSQERKFKHALGEIERKQQVAQQASDDMKKELDEKVVSLQKTQHLLSERTAHIEALENEILRLKAQAGDAETLDIIKETLREQVAHITKLEAATQKQQTELRHYRKQQKTIEIVEEEKRALEVKVRMMHDLGTQLSEAQLQRQILEDERNSWSAYLENLSANDEDLKFDSPEVLAKAYLQEREERVSLIEKLGNLQSDLAAKDLAILTLEEQSHKLQEEMEQLRNVPKGPDPKAQARLERQRTLAIKEVEYLRAQLKMYDAEEGESQPENHDEQKMKRVQELEEIVDQHRKELESLHKALIQAEKNIDTKQYPPPQLSPIKSSSLKRTHSPGIDNDRLGELTRKNRTLQDDLSKLLTARVVLEKELAAHKSQLTSLKATSRTRVLELRSNPTADAEAVKKSTLDALRAENAALLTQLEEQAQNISQPPSFPPSARSTKPKVVPQAVLDRMRSDMEAQETVLASKDKHALRLRQIFTLKTTEFRDAIASTLGWDFRFMPNGRVKCSSIFYPSSKGDGGADGAGDEEEDNYIIFDGEQGTMKVSGGPQSTFANEIRGLIEFWVDGRKEIPCFLAACTLEFWERSTRGAVGGGGGGRV